MHALAVSQSGGSPYVGYVAILSCLLYVAGFAVWNRALMDRFLARYMIVHGVDLRDEFSQVPFLERLGLWPLRTRSTLTRMVPRRLASALVEESTDRELEWLRWRMTSASSVIMALAPLPGFVVFFALTSLGV